jgi:hypothetical protein
MPNEHGSTKQQTLQAIARRAQHRLSWRERLQMNDVGVWTHKMPAMYHESALAIYNLALGRSFM